MSASLSKKKQKALAFKNKRKGIKPDAVLDVPQLDLLDQDDQEPNAELDDPADPAPPVIPSQRVTGKRKRDDQPEVDAQEPAQPAKKKKKPSTTAKDNSKETPATEDKENAQKQPSKFILFLGNLRYTTTKEQIAQHFSACVPPPDIRLLTPKAVPGKPTRPSIKSKGCAFLEFKSHNTLQQGLKLHNSELDGRKINVELTAGGGGKSATRLDKVRQRNKALGQERKKRLVKSGAASEEQAAADLAKPQRHSATSGEERAVVARKTWSVPVADEEAGRGGKKHAKKQRGAKKSSTSKPWLSGANAIAVE